ncbi:MAG: ABC transporter permease, partial [Nitrospirales bacterium]|nr:ABC transporter permease [Nitrospirales bacterium]
MFLTDSFRTAFSLIVHLDAALGEIILLSLRVSGTALVFASATGLPLAVLLGMSSFPGRSGIISVLNTFMGLPPVVVGLFLYLLLSRSGPLGYLGLLYTPSAMVIAQA